MVSWKRNVFVIWCSQFLSVAGFSFGLPFIPYYIQELGVRDPVALKLWVSICFAATPLSLAVFAPIWGALADRFGRRLMLLRANFAATLVVALMGTAGSVWVLAALRLLQGVFTGTVTAARTMTAVHAPPERSGIALGSLSSAVFSGGMGGAFLGGIVAEHVGYRAAFFVGSGLLFLAGCLVWIGSEEKVGTVGERGESWNWRVFFNSLNRGPIVPILILIVAMAFVRRFDRPLLPLLIQDINGSLEGASFWNGSLRAVCCVAGILGGFIVGRLADLTAPGRIAQYAALGAGILMLPHAMATGFAFLFPIRFGMFLCAAALEPIFYIWLTKVTTEGRRGFIFGWAGTAKALGWMVAPLISGGVATQFGIRSIFVGGSICFFLLVPLISAVTKAVERSGRETGVPLEHTTADL